MLDQVNGFTQEEIEEAIAYFDETFPAWKGLLNEWGYDDTHRFKDPETGKRIAENRIRDLVDKLENSYDDYILDLTDELEEEGEVGPWANDFSYTLLLAAFLYYLLGRGGLTKMEDGDWQIVTDEVNSQYAYLGNFANDMTGGLSKAQINSRSAMYLASLRQLYSRGRASSFGLVLPAHPGQGSECLFNCKCHWRIVEHSDRWECFWERTALESCPTCIQRSSMWNPYIVYK